MTPACASGDVMTETCIGFQNPEEGMADHTTRRSLVFQEPLAYYVGSGGGAQYVYIKRPSSGERGWHSVTRLQMKGNLLTDH